jgi:hypothetical protein
LGDGGTHQGEHGLARLDLPAVFDEPFEVRRRSGIELNPVEAELFQGLGIVTLGRGAVAREEIGI